MQMIARGISRAAHKGNDVSDRHRLSHCSVQCRAMRVQRCDAAAMTDHHIVPITRMAVPRQQNGPICRCADLRSFRRGHVKAPVAFPFSCNRAVPSAHFRRHPVFPATGKGTDKCPADVLRAVVLHEARYQPVAHAAHRIGAIFRQIEYLRGVCLPLLRELRAQQGVEPGVNNGHILFRNGHHIFLFHFDGLRNVIILKLLFILRRVVFRIRHFHSTYTHRFADIAARERLRLALAQRQIRRPEIQRKKVCFHSVGAKRDRTFFQLRIEFSHRAVQYSKARAHLCNMPRVLLRRRGRDGPVSKAPFHGRAVVVRRGVHHPAQAHDDEDEREQKCREDRPHGISCLFIPRKRGGFPDPICCCNRSCQNIPPKKIWGGMENRPAAPPCFLTICRQRCRMFPDAAPATRPPCRTGRRTDAAARCRPSYSRAVSSRSPHRSEIRSASLYSRNTGTAGISVYSFSAPPAAPTLPHGPEKR